jgi:hypothetical protein
MNIVICDDEVEWMENVRVRLEEAAHQVTVFNGRKTNGVPENDVAKCATMLEEHINTHGCVGVVLDIRWHHFPGSSDFGIRMLAELFHPSSGKRFFPSPLRVVVFSAYANNPAYRLRLRQLGLHDDDIIDRGEHNAAAKLVGRFS